MHFGIKGDTHLALVICDKRLKIYIIYIVYKIYKNMKWLVTFMFLCCTLGLTEESKPIRLYRRGSWLNNAINAFVDKMSNVVAQTYMGKHTDRDCQNLECYMNAEN